jgi:methionyl-tRNA synthetase
MFVEKFFGSVIPDVELIAEDKELLSNVNEELKGYVECVDKARLRDGLRHILSISRHGNQYMQVNQPWVLVKGSDAEK